MGVSFKTLKLKMMIRRSRQIEKDNHRDRRARSCYPEMERTTSLSRFPFREIRTLTQERRKARDIENNKYCLPNRTGDSRFHTTWSINEKETEFGWLLTLADHAPCSVQQRQGSSSQSFTKYIPTHMKRRFVKSNNRNFNFDTGLYIIIRGRKVRY